MTLVKATIGVVLAMAGVASVAGDPRGLPSEGPADFLQGLAGEWSVVSEATLGPGQDPIRTESREVARLLGGQWLVAEGTGTSALGSPMTSIFTLGYDPARGGFVATWIDSMQTHLWWYTGQLDDTGTALTLETEGPIMGDATRTTAYRVVIVSVEADHKVRRSLILGPNGEWFEFARAEYQRRR
jgi:hypothetical protein